MTVCNRCGKEIPDHYKFCLGCGAERTGPKPGGGDMGMMKTMMADPGQAPVGPGAPLRGPSAAMPQPVPPGMGRQTGGMGGGMPGPGMGGGMPGPGMGAPMGPGPMGPGPGMGGMPTGPAPMGGAPMATPQRARLSMTLIRPDGTEGGTHDLRPGENKLGRSFGPVFENDGNLSPVHALLDIRGQNAVVRDMDSLNGVFVKMTQEEELQSGQIIRIGQELLRFEIIPTPEPTADGTELMGSPNPGFWGKLTVIIGRDVTGAAFPLLGDSVTLGRERGEINFPDDGYVSGLHARVSLRDGRVYLAALGSSNGTFIKVNGERAVGHDSFVLLGQQLFRLNFS